MAKNSDMVVIYKNGKKISFPRPEGWVDQNEEKKDKKEKKQEEERLDKAKADRYGSNFVEGANTKNAYNTGDRVIHNGQEVEILQTKRDPRYGNEYLIRGDEGNIWVVDDNIEPATNKDISNREIWQMIADKNKSTNKNKELEHWDNDTKSIMEDKGYMKYDDNVYIHPDTLTEVGKASDIIRELERNDYDMEDPYVKGFVNDLKSKGDQEVTVKYDDVNYYGDTSLFKKGNYKIEDGNSELKQKEEVLSKAREDENSIDPMTENSTDWEALDKKYKDRYLKEKIGNDSEKLHKYADEEGILPSQLQDRLGIKDSDLGLKDDYTKKFEEEMQGMERYLKAEEAKKTTHVPYTNGGVYSPGRLEELKKEKQRISQDDIDKSYMDTAKKDKARQEALSGIPGSNYNKKIYNEEAVKEAKSNTSKYDDYYKKEKLGTPSNYKAGDEIEFDTGYYSTLKGKVIKEADEKEKKYQMNSNLKGYVVRDQYGYEHIVPDTRILNKEKMVEKTNKAYKDNKPILDSQKKTINEDIKDKATSKKRLNKAWLEYKLKHPGTKMSKDQFEKEIYNK